MLSPQYEEARRPAIDETLKTRPRERDHTKGRSKNVVKASKVDRTHGARAKRTLTQRCPHADKDVYPLRKRRFTPTAGETNAVMVH